MHGHRDGVPWLDPVMSWLDRSMMRLDPDMSRRDRFRQFDRQRRVEIELRRKHDGTAPAGHSRIAACSH